MMEETGNHTYSKVEGIEMKIQALQERRESIKEIADQIEAAGESGQVRAKWKKYNDGTDVLEITIETSSINEELEILMARPDIEGQLEYVREASAFRFYGEYSSAFRFNEEHVPEYKI